MQPFPVSGQRGWLFLLLLLFSTIFSRQHGKKLYFYLEGEVEPTNYKLKYNITQKVSERFWTSQHERTSGISIVQPSSIMHQRNLQNISMKRGVLVVTFIKVSIIWILFFHDRNFLIQDLFVTLVEVDNTFHVFYKAEII